MDKEAAAKKYAEILKRIGFIPEIDKEYDVQFMFEGGRYIILLDAKDDNFFRLCYPNFFDITEEHDEVKVCLAANAANRSVKAVKVFTVGTNMWATIEMFTEGDISQGQTILRMLAALQVSVKVFAEHLSQLIKK